MKTEEQVSTLQSIIEQRHAAERAVVEHQNKLIAERQGCEKRIQEIAAELKASGYKVPRKPRTKKVAQAS